MSDIYDALKRAFKTAETAQDLLVARAQMKEYGRLLDNGQVNELYQEMDYRFYQLAEELCRSGDVPDPLGRDGLQ